MKLFREKNIQQLIEGLEYDEYDDVLQDSLVNVDEMPESGHNFLNLYLTAALEKFPNGNVLEIGCGGGSLFNKYPITHAIEPATGRFKVAVAEGKKHGVTVTQEVAECVGFDDNFFCAVIMINGFFQVRSDHEALIEINRIMVRGGVCVLSLLTNDEIDIVQGRVLGVNNYIRMLGQFGFSCIGKIACNAGPRFTPPKQVNTFIAIQKDRDFDYRWLAQPQVNPEHIINYLEERDWRLK